MYRAGGRRRHPVKEQRAYCFTCCECSRKFDAAKSNAIYCSGACRKQASRDRLTIGISNNGRRPTEVKTQKHKRKGKTK